MMVPKPELVTVDIDSGVALLTWNRPERHNAWGPELRMAYFEALRLVEADPRVRAIVVTGAGRTFCPGADGQGLKDLTVGPIDTRGLAPDPENFPTTIAKPLVAAINGACAGIGLLHALFCDVRFAAEGVKLTTAFARRGIMAEHGLAWLLPKIVGMGHAMDLLLSGRVLLADEAARIGLVNRAVPSEQLIATALAYASDLARNSSPLAMVTIKRQLYAGAEQGFEQARAESLDLWYDQIKPHTDFAEGVASFLERRAPNFAPLTPPKSSAPEPG
jgi:enoyl-CoA hydratase/carnithine racemase